MRLATPIILVLWIAGAAPAHADLLPEPESPPDWNEHPPPPPPPPPDPELARTALFALTLAALGAAVVLLGRRPLAEVESR